MLLSFCTSLCCCVPKSLCHSVTPVTLSIYLSIPRSLCRTIPLSLCPSVHLSLCPSVPLSYCPSVPLSHCSFVALSYCFSVTLSVCPTVRSLFVSVYPDRRVEHGPLLSSPTPTPHHLTRQILTSYIDVSSPWETRQHELESQYAFTCSCPLCLSTAPRDDPSSAPAASSSTPTASTAPTASAARDSPVTAAALASTTKPQADPRWCLLHQTCSQGEGGLIPMPKILTPHSTPILARAVESGLGFDGRKQGKCEGCGEVVPVDVTALPGWIEKAKMMIRLDEEGSLCEWCGSLRLRLLGLRCRHLAMDESHQPLSLYGSLAGPSRLAVRDDGGTIR